VIALLEQSLMHFTGTVKIQKKYAKAVGKNCLISIDTVGALALFCQQQLLYYMLFVKDKSMGH
jgi:hypothetical protein